MCIRDRIRRVSTTAVSPFTANGLNSSFTVKRNRVKRQIREAYRMNKHGLLAVLTEKKCRLAVAFSYLSDQLVDSSVIEDRMKTALARIAEKVAANAERCV